MVARNSVGAIRKRKRSGLRIDMHERRVPHYSAHQKVRVSADFVSPTVRILMRTPCRYASKLFCNVGRGRLLIALAPISKCRSGNYSEASMSKIFGAGGDNHCGRPVPREVLYVNYDSKSVLQFTLCPCRWSAISLHKRRSHDSPIIAFKVPAHARGLSSLVVRHRDFCSD